MNEAQYKIVKTWLNDFKIPPRKLATAWKIELPLVKRVAATITYEDFVSMPEEDILTFFGGRK